MLLSEARTIVRNGVLHVGDEGDSQYGDCVVDTAIQAVLGELVNYTKCVWTKTDVALPASASSVDLTGTTGLTYLQPNFFDHARINNARVQRSDQSWVNRRLAAYPNKTGQPTHIAPETPTFWLLYPKTDAAYTLTVVHNGALIAWTPGTKAAVTLNVPDRYIRQPIWAGVAAYTVAGEEGGGQSWVVLARKDYEEYREWLKGVASVDSGINNSNPYLPSPVATIGRQALKKGA